MGGHAVLKRAFIYFIYFFFLCCRTRDDDGKTTDDDQTRRRQNAQITRITKRTENEIKRRPRDSTGRAREETAQLSLPDYKIVLKTTSKSNLKSSQRAS